jgi:flagellar motor switch protein FliM
VNDFLSADEIDALFEKANQGKLPVEPTAVGAGRTRWLRTVDFTRPSKFGTDQQRRLRRVMEVFCATASTRMSGEHRIALDLEVIDVGQLTFASAMESIPEASVAAVVETPGSDAKMLLSAELILVLEVIERLLGGNGDGMTERRLTDIEMVLARRLFGTLVECLSATWFDVCGVSLELGRIDPLSEGPAIVPASEPTLVLTVEARMARRSTTLAFVVPYAAIAPVAASFSSRAQAADLATDPRAAAAVAEGLRGVDVVLRAEVADTSMPLEDVIALRPGDVVRFEAQAGDEVVVYADATPVHRARAGRSGTRRAIQLLGPYAGEGS